MSLFGVTHSLQYANPYIGTGPVEEKTDTEKYWTGLIARETVRELRAMGHDVIEGPNGNSYRENVDFYNAHPTIALGHEIHTNATGVPGLLRTGAMIGYVSPKGKEAASAISRAMTETRFPGGCTITDSIRVAVMFTRPVITLGEYGYHDNPNQADFIRTHYADIAHGIALGMHAYAPGTATPLSYPVPLPPAASKPWWVPNLVVNGIKDRATWLAIQSALVGKYHLPATIDGTPDGTTYRLMKMAYNARNNTRYGVSSYPFNAAWVKLFQKMLGVKQDGLWGRETTRALQRMLNRGEY